MQVCPVAANTPAMTPLTALSRSASSKTICGDLPPSSSDTRAPRAAAVAPMRSPVVVEPVKAILSTPGWSTSAAPVGPRPVTTLNTPFGTPASTASSASSSVEVGVTSDGLATTVLPAASAGNSFQPRRPSGVFHGVMAATTPIGSRTV